MPTPEFTPPTAEALAEQLLPCKHPDLCGMRAAPGICVWHDCHILGRPAVTGALQAKDSRIAELEADLERAKRLMEEAADFVSQRMCNPNEFVMRLRAAAGEQRENQNG